MNAGTDAGAMPANVSENVRPMLIAGLAKLVELVKPVGGADVRADGRRGGTARFDTRQREDDEQQAERWRSPRRTGARCVAR